MPALDAELNRAILDIAAELFPKGFDLSPRAPATLQQLRSLGTGRFVIYDGAAERTVYGDPSVNFAFRAWHDFCHLHGGHETNFVGEVAACRVQTLHLLRRYGDSARTFRWRAIIEADIIGQARYFERHGFFPKDQAAFVQTYLGDQLGAISSIF